MSAHIMEVVDPYDDGTTVCRGCRAQGTFTEVPGGDCPTPYKSDRQLLAEALERVTSLRALLAECAEYLNTNNLTSIGHGSILHRKMIEAAAMEPAP